MSDYIILVVMLYYTSYTRQKQKGSFNPGSVISIAASLRGCAYKLVLKEAKSRMHISYR